MSDPSRRQFLVGTGLSTAGLLALPGATPLASAAAQPPAPVTPVRPGDWAWVRRQFNLTPRRVHMAAFFMASHPKPVRAAIARFRDELDANPFDTYVDKYENLTHRVQHYVANYIGGRPEEVALTQSTTMGLSTVYHGVRLRPGDDVLLTAHDHYSQHESARFACERAGATLRKIPLYGRLEYLPRITEEEIADRYRQAIRPNTRLVGTTWVHSSSGLRMPLRAIAGVIREANRNRAERDHALLVVDGVHGFGAIDEDVAQSGCDLFATGGHKWIYGPRGTGFVWARAGAWRRMLPLIPTFNSHELEEAWMQQRPSRNPVAEWFIAGGFHAYEHDWALADAIKFHASLGRRAVADRIYELNNQLREGLAQMRRVRIYTPLLRNLSAGLLVFDVDGVAAREVVARLKTMGIIGSQTPYARAAVRLSAGIVNSPEDVERTLRALREIGAAK